MPSIIGLDGFGHGINTPSLWTAGNLYSNYFNGGGAAPTVTSSAARSGGYGLRFGSDAARATTWLLYAGGSLQTVVCSFYIRVNTTAVADIVFMFEYDSGGRYFFVRTDGTGKVFLECSGIASSGNSSNSMSANTWARVDIRIVTSATPWTVDWQLDGTAQTTFSPAEGTTTKVLTNLGPRSSSASIQVDFDDIVWSSTSGDYPLGQYQVLSLLPNASGTHNLDQSPSLIFFGHNGTSGTGLSTGETALYGYMDDVPVNGSSDFLYITGTPGSGQYAELLFEDPVYVPVSVRLIEAVRQNGTAGGSSYTSKLYDGSTEGVAQNAFDPASLTEIYRAAVFQNAPSGASWSASLLNSTRARFGYTTDASPEIRVYAALLEVASTTELAVIPPVPTIRTVASPLRW